MALRENEVGSMWLELVPVSLQAQVLFDDL